LGKEQKKMVEETKTCTSVFSSAAAAKSGASSCGVIYPNILRRLTDLAKSLQEDQSMQDGISGHPIQSNPLMLN
jgi:hypothetical protein